MIAKSKHYYQQQVIIPKNQLMIAKNKHQCQIYTQTNLG